MKQNKNIIVTGAHRSGTTWTGHVLSSAPSMRLVGEIFNLANAPRRNPFSNWFQYVHADSPAEFLSRVEAYVERETNSGPICLKDPISIMSIEWLANKLDANVVFCIRHPAAFAGSLKVKDWKHDFTHFLRQPELMARFPSIYCNQIIEYAKQPPDIIDQAILLWNIIYDQVDEYRALNKPGWHFVRHEDLSRCPPKSFRLLFDKLKLSFSQQTEEFLTQTTRATAGVPFSRNSVANIGTWRQRLTIEEIERVTIGTESVWRRYYKDTDWA